MSGFIYDFFGYPATDQSSKAALTAEAGECPLLHDVCTKKLSRDGDLIPSGACAVKQISSPEPIICCPVRLYARDYELLRIITLKAFGEERNLYPADIAVEKAREENGAVAVFGHRWGRELRLPKRDGQGNYFADWVLALLDGNGELQEFTSIEVQTIDTTGNYRDSRDGLLNGRRMVKSSVGLNWENVAKRIIPQLVYKGQVLQREKYCRTGLWFVTPQPVFERILTRLGGMDNIAFGYSPQPGALHFFRYDFDLNSPRIEGEITPLKLVGLDTTTVEQVQSAFNRVMLPEPGVYGQALRESLSE